MWQLERPTPALPSSYFWTWDHSTNWMLDDPGNLTFGFYNTYLKRPETYLEDYRRMTDLCAGLGIKGILIWGFLRDSHGGVEYGKRVAEYAASKGVAIMPGVGTTHYGGIYFEGDHPFCINTFLRDHPDARMIGEDGEPYQGGVCPSHPAFRTWMSEGLDWLFREFAIGGVNLENGDFLVCHCPRCKAYWADWPADDPEFFRQQAMSYIPALDDLAPHMANNLITWATYTGFVPGSKDDYRTGTYLKGNMFCPRPVLIDRIPPQSITQWTITGMVRQANDPDPAMRPLPLSAYLDNGAPEAALIYPGWPTDLRAPGNRGVGFLHQGSQWYGDRYELFISTIKEACLRAYRAGLEGVSIMNETTLQHVPSALNYLAFSHFIHWPEDTLRDFGRNTLGQILESPDEGELYIELLAALEGGPLTEEQTKRMADIRMPMARTICTWSDRNDLRILDRWRFWDWLQMQATHGLANRMRVSTFL